MQRRKLCRCRKVIGYRDEYCDECTLKIEDERSEYHRIYDRYTMDKDSSGFYNSYEWRRVRENILNKYNGLYFYAYFIDNEIVHADTVDHNK